MDPERLYPTSHDRKPELSHRSLVLAIRYGLADWTKGVDVDKMQAAIETGRIWQMRGVGQKTAREWCSFITRMTEAILPQTPGPEAASGELPGPKQVTPAIKDPFSG